MEGARKRKPHHLYLSFSCSSSGAAPSYTYDQNGAPVGMRVNGLDYIFRKNLQGDITGIYDSSADLIVEYSYADAWGAGVTVSGSQASTIGMYNSFRYRGYYYDTESGLYYLNSRYYDPVACRFINADGYVSTGQGNAGYNMYSYCGNNPINYVDKTGKFLISISASFAVLFFASLVLTVTAVVLTQPQVQQGISNGVASVANSISSITSKDESKEKSISKANTKRRIKDSDPRIHHVVAQRDRRCEPARAVLQSFGIDPINDLSNKIVIPQGLHKSLHTNKYYDYVNTKILTCEQSEEAVKTALLEIKLDILFASETGIRKWDVT